MSTPRKPKPKTKRREKASRKPRATAIAPAAPVVEGFDSEAMLRVVAQKLQQEYFALSTCLAADDDEIESMVKNKARLAAVISQIHAQLRQIEKKSKRELASYTLDELTSHLKTFPDTVRGEIAREITGADDQEPLL